MQEVTILGQCYRTGTLNAFAQMYILKRAAPVLGKLDDLLHKVDDAHPEAMIDPLGEVIAKLPDESLEYVCNACLDVCERRMEGGGFAPLRKNGALMFADLDLLTLIALTAHTLKDNLAGFFRALPSLAPAGGAKETAQASSS